MVFIKSLIQKLNRFRTKVQMNYITFCGFVDLSVKSEIQKYTYLTLCFLKNKDNESRHISVANIHSLINPKRVSAFSSMAHEFKHLNHRQNI